MPHRRYRPDDRYRSDDRYRDDRYRKPKKKEHWLMEILG